MFHKFLWLDTETTGLDPVENDIIQLAGYMIAPGKETQEFNFKMKPRNPEAIAQEALDTHGISKEEMMVYPDPSIIHKEFKRLLKKFVNPYDKNDKFILAGQNVQFDNNFVHEWFKKEGDKYWFSWVDYSQFDLKNLIIIYEMLTGKKLGQSRKLVNVAPALGVELPETEAHDALADIKATRECCNKIWQFIKKGHKNE